MACSWPWAVRRLTLLLAAHAVIETSTGYRIRLEFNPATLSTNGLGGAKIKVTRLVPDGTEIKLTGGETPGNLTAAEPPSPKPPLPPPVAEVRLGSHWPRQDPNPTNLTSRPPQWKKHWPMRSMHCPTRS